MATCFLIQNKRGISGYVDDFININPWKQFFDLKGRKDIPLSFANNITIKNCDISCKTFFNVKPDNSQYILSDFTFADLKINAKYTDYSESAIENIIVQNVLLYSAHQ